MALSASLYRVDCQLGLDVRLGEQRERVRDDPPADSPIDWSAWVFEWDADALDEGRREFLGLFVARLDRVTDKEIDALDHLPLACVDVPDLRLINVPVSTVVRRARDSLLARQIRSPA